jgi:VWFA-related protein
MTRRSLIYSLPWFAAAGSLTAQDRPTFSAGVKVVNIFATVRDKKGQVIRNLTKDDFQLEEEGRQQQIRYFSQESNLPLTIGLLIDTSGSTRNVLPQERSASYHFLRQVMRQNEDVAFLIRFDFEAELLQDVTGSHSLLEAAMEDVEPAGMQRRPPIVPPWGPGGRGRWGGRGGGGGTVLYDAVYLAAEELMKKQEGRKALILLTDGLDNGSQKTLAQAEEAAQRSDTLVYSILFEDPEMQFRGFGGRMPRGLDGGDILKQLSRVTGGRFFEVTKRSPIERVFVDIEEDLRNQYSLGYTPESDNNNSREYRKIRLTAKPKGLIVQAREGYYPG